MKDDLISREQAKKFLYEKLDRLNDDELYDIFSRIIDDMYNELPSVTASLPKGHGDLIDRNVLLEELIESDKSHAENSREEALLYRNRRIIREQPIIIKADKESD